MRFYSNISLSVKKLVIVFLLFNTSTLFADTIVKSGTLFLPHIYKPNEVEHVRFFLVGESHYMRHNKKIFFDIFRNLNTYYNVTGIILEEGPAQTYFLNRYLESGDKNYLHHGHFDFANYKMIENIRLLNSNNDTPIQFFGVDYEWKTWTILFAIEDMILKHKIDSLPISLENYCLTRMGGGINICHEALRPIYKDYIKNPQIYHHLMHEDSIVFGAMMRSYAASLVFDKTDHNRCLDTALINAREQYLADEIDNILKSHPNQKFFGQFGSLHIPYMEQKPDYFSRCPYPWKSMMARLVELHDKKEFFSIQILYQKKSRQESYRYWFNDDKDIIKKLSKKVKRKRYRIIRLDKSDDFSELNETNFSMFLIHWK